MVNNCILTPKMISMEALRQMAYGSSLPRPLAKATIPKRLCVISMRSFGEVLAAMAEPAKSVEFANEIADDQHHEVFGDYQCYVGIGEKEIFIAVGPVKADPTP